MYTIFLYSSSIIIFRKKKKLTKTGTWFGGGVPHAPVVEKYTYA